MRAFFDSWALLPLTMAVGVGACTLAVSLPEATTGTGGTSPGGGGATSSPGGGGSGGLGGAGGAGGQEPPLLVPKEGIYVFTALQSQGVNGLNVLVGGATVTDESVDAQDPFPAAVQVLNPASIPAEGYDGCWRITFRFRAVDEPNGWQDALEFCSRDGRLELQQSQQIQCWPFLNLQTATNNLIDCRASKGFSPVTLIEPPCPEGMPGDGCMAPDVGSFFVNCQGSNDAVTDAFTLGGRVTWLQGQEELLTIGGTDVEAFRIFEEQTMASGDEMATFGVLDADSDLSFLGARINWWFHKETGMVLRVSREVALQTDFVLDFGNGNAASGVATYTEDWAFELTDLNPDPLPGNIGDDPTCGNPPMGGGGAGAGDNTGGGGGQDGM